MPFWGVCYLGDVSELGLGLVFFSSVVYVYLLYLFFCTLFIFDVIEFKTLSSLKNFGKLSVVAVTFVLFLLSVAGIPPLAGFVSKFLMFNFLYLSQFFYFIFLFSFVNFFTMYFYLQCLRFTVAKSQLNVFIICGFRVWLNKITVTGVVILNLFNFFSILLSIDLFFWFFNLILQKCVF